MNRKSIGSTNKFRRDDQEPEMDVKQFDIGQITVADVEEAISNKLSIINFSQPISKEIQNLINENDVQVYNHDVIYKLFDEVETGNFEYFQCESSLILNLPKKDEFL